MFKWIFSGLNVNVYQCHLDSISIIMKLDDQPNQTKQMVENPQVMIHNSSFRSLDLNPGTKAQIIQCYINANYIPSPTLITANNANVSIQNCLVRDFINKNGSTILFRQNNSVTIENSVFIQHNSSKGVIFLYNNSSMSISSSLFLHNVATFLGYSSISLMAQIRAAVYDTVFRNNSALAGGAVHAQNKCHVTLTNCTFSSNKAITGKTLNIPNSPKVQMTAPAIGKDNMETFTPTDHKLFNRTSLHGKKDIIAHPASLLAKRFILKDKSAQPKGGIGGAVFVAIESHLLVINCTAKDNSAQETAGAIGAGHNVTLDIQETNFSSNRAVQGGAIYLDTVSSLYMKSCAFKDNYAEESAGVIAASIDAVLEINRSHFLNNSAFFGGVILATSNVTLNLQETTFVANKAFSDSGVIFLKYEGHLQITSCIFEENISGQVGGAIFGGYNVTVDIKNTYFTGNSAAQGGAIDLKNQSYLQTTNCIFEHNHADLGGALFMGFDSVCEINGSYIHNNTASQGGAINMQHEANVFITKSKMEGNFAGDMGGAILVAFNATLLLLETKFRFNSASDEVGALAVYQSECDVVWCIFHNNSAKAVGGAVYISATSSVTIENTNFINNNGSDGGAIYIEANSTVQAYRCRFLKNFAKQAGGAIELRYYSAAVIECCHLLSNQAIHGGAVNLNNPKIVFLLETSFLRNEASNRSGAVAINDGTNVTINNITCIGNQSPRGGCLQIQSVTLILHNSNITDNFGLQYASGIAAYDSKLQVSRSILRSTLF